jgi:hypothetical protein
MRHTKREYNARTDGTFRVAIGRYKTVILNQSLASRKFSLIFVTRPSGVSNPRTT